MYRQTFFRSAIAFVSLLCSLGVQGDEKPIRITIAAAHATTIPWVSELHDFVVPAFTREMKRLRPNLQLEWIEAYGGSLYRWQDTLEGVQIGLADIGWVGTLWENSKLPLQNITYGLPFISDDLPKLLQVINQLHEQIPALRQAWTNYNQVFLGASGVDTYHLMTKTPIQSLDDLRGKKILAPGTSAVWFQGTGAVPVDGALSTYYTQLKTGVADGVVTILSGAYPYRLYEVAPYITLVSIGAQFTGAVSVNLRFWQSLSPEIQASLKAIGHQYTQRTSLIALQRYQKALSAMAQAGATISSLPAAEKRRWITLVSPLATKWVARYEEKHLPASEVLVGLMNGLRELGVNPMHNWDEQLGK